MQRTKRKSKIRDAVINHVSANIKEYLIVLIIFAIGIILGVLFINNTSESQSTEISQYINNFLASLKENSTIDKANLLKTSMIENVILAVLLWFIGSTVVGIPVVYAIIGFRGFCLGYTISSAIAVLGASKGILFVVLTVLLQNIIFIPCIVALAVSGIRLYKSIMKDKRKENIKLEIVRHTIFSVMISIALLISSFIEVYVSSNLLMLCLRFLVN